MDFLLEAQLKRKTIGFPLMKMEAGERRVFLPEFIQMLSQMGFDVFIEEGYGSRSGLMFDDYKKASPNIYMCSRADVFRQDYVLILRFPRREECELIGPGSILISMVHYQTRPGRVARLIEQDINAISLDSIVDDNNVRLVQNMQAVGWNGLEVAFDVLEENCPGLLHYAGRPWQVLVLGTGMVGRHAVDAGARLGNIERYNEHIARGGQGVIVTSVGRSVSSNAVIMERLFKQSDVLVDATQRRNTFRPVVPNDWIGWLPEHAVVADLAVDPYLLDTQTPVVRGIEGTPRGNLDKYVFHPDDPDWDLYVPSAVPSVHRRRAVTCYSWPGIHPESCMRHYAQQMAPLMEVFSEKDYGELSPTGSYFERALYRATLHGWLEIRGQEI